MGVWRLCVGFRLTIARCQCRRRCCDVVGRREIEDRIQTLAEREGERTTDAVDRVQLSSESHQTFVSDDVVSFAHDNACGNHGWITSGNQLP